MNKEILRKVGTNANGRCHYPVHFAPSLEWFLNN